MIDPVYGFFLIICLWLLAMFKVYGLVTIKYLQTFKLSGQKKSEDSGKREEENCLRDDWEQRREENKCCDRSKEKERDRYGQQTRDQRTRIGRSAEDENSHHEQQRSNEGSSSEQQVPFEDGLGKQQTQVTADDCGVQRTQDKSSCYEKKAPRKKVWSANKSELDSSSEGSSKTSTNSQALRTSDIAKSSSESNISMMSSKETCSTKQKYSSLKSSRSQQHHWKRLSSSGPTTSELIRRFESKDRSEDNVVRHRHRKNHVSVTKLVDTFENLAGNKSRHYVHIPLYPY
ncbi:zinc finger CCCH domain-containing protein 18-like isoform X2 [Octopus sinensis]|uniref:Zinc finger CCCH domain-containing protein 18-like isoform X2 n=1 Tax=Octopus sinensis TaxID=2607531 RepID=A0A6P7TM77_9MOLL|nr:zinc finger CCCH domain-containing protein 18-like isoform X2 [Octopus sinensis]